MHHLSFFGLAFLFVLITGCSDVTFQEPIPLNRKNLRAFPETWQGSWVDTDGVLYNISPTSISPEDTSNFRPIELGPSALIRRFQGYLVVNMQHEDDTWQVLLAKRKKNQVILYQFDASNENSLAIWEAILGSSMRQKSVQLNELKQNTYVLSPKNNLALRQLIFKGGLTELGTLTQKTD